MKFGRASNLRFEDYYYPLVHFIFSDGYSVEHDGLCTTVFSAPNYVDQSGNLGAFIRIDDAGSQECKQFEKQWHPPLKPMHYAQGGLASMLM